MAYNKITLNGETKIDLTQDTVTAGDVALGKTFHLSSGEIATGTHTTQLQEKTVTPTKSVQEVTPDASYDGLGKVNVNAIPSEYIVPTGTKSITTNGTHAVSEYANVEVSVPSQTPNLITKEITENRTYNASDDGADGYSSVTVNVASSGGGGGGAGFDPVFANNTPDQISKASALISYNNMTSAEVEANFGWKIGDKISYQLTTGTNVEMRIIGFNHDTITGGGKAGITLETVGNFIAAKMNNTSTNAGGYPASLIKTTTMPEIKATLPQEWQNVIKMVDKKSANGGSDNYTGIITTSEDLFILSEIEASGTNKWSLPEVEGARYQLYNSKSFIRPTTYWTRTPVYSNIKAFVVVNTDGSIGGNSANSNNYIPFAFCI